MQPFINVFGRPIPTFGLMIALAGIVSFCILFFYARRRKLPADDVLNFFLMCFIGGIVGAGLLHVLLELPGLIADWSELVAPLPFKEALGAIFARVGGLVFYGGFIGAAVSVLLYSKLAKVPLLQYLDFLAPVAPIAHAIGRVGCLLGGCCYGMEVSHTHPFAIVYPEASLSAPPGVPLLAVPLIESCCNIIIACLLFLFSHYTITKKKNYAPGRVVALYALLYAPARFIIEFFRGDEIRGVYGGISTSQIISIAIFAGGATLFFFAPKLKPAALEAWDRYERKQEKLRELRKLWEETHKNS